MKRVLFHTDTLRQDRRGLSVVEVLLAGAVFAVLVTALVGAVIYGQQTTAIAGERARAVDLANEGIEAVRNIRDEDFANLAAGTYGLAIQGGQWVFSGSSDTTGGFTRQVVLSQLDSETFQVTVTVTWQQNRQRQGTIGVTTYLKHWMLVSAGSWTTPAQMAAIDVPNNHNGWRVAVQGDYVYMVRQGGNPDFVVMDVSTPSSPSAVFTGNLPSNPRDIKVSGNYAYVASTSNFSEFQVIDISTPTSPSWAGSLNASGSADGRGVYIDGSRAYLVRSSSSDDEFVIIDISTPASPSSLGTENLRSASEDVYVNGSYAYAATYRNNQEFQVVDISNPNNPNVVADIDLSGNENLYCIDGYGNTVFAGRETGDFYVIDISTPTSPSVTGSYDLGGAIFDLDANQTTQLVFTATRTGNPEFQVVDVSTPASPYTYGSVNAAARLRGVVYDEPTNRAFAVGNANAEEFIEIHPN